MGTSRVTQVKRFPYDEDSDWVLDRVAVMDPGDHSGNSEYLRELARSVADHRAMAERRAAWAAADAGE